MKFCPRFGKECFEQRADAMRALTNMTKRKHTKGSVYFCEFCNSWHVTRIGFEGSKNLQTVLKKHKDRLL